MSKPRRAQEVFSAGEEESATYVPPSDPLIIGSPVREVTHGETAQALGKVIFRYLIVILFSLLFS